MPVSASPALAEPLIQDINPGSALWCGKALALFIIGLGFIVFLAPLITTIGAARDPAIAMITRVISPSTSVPRSAVHPPPPLVSLPPWLRIRRAQEVAKSNPVVRGLQSPRSLSTGSACARPSLTATRDPEAEFADLRGVIVFSREGCPYCVKAKSLLTNSGIPFQVVDVGVEPQRREEAVKRSGGLTTVPQVFVGMTALGGFDNVSSLAMSGELQEILRRHSASGRKDAILPTPAKAFGRADLLPQDAMESLRKEGQRIAEKQKVGQIKPGKKPSLWQFLSYALDRKPLAYDPDVPCLNEVGRLSEYAPSAALATLPVESLLSALRTQMLRLTDCFVDADGNVDYVSLKESEEFYNFWALASELGGARADEIQSALASFSENDKKAFLINLYNVMIFHGVTEFGRRGGTWFLYSFFITPLVSYRVGRARLSLDEVEHGLLRRRPEYFKDTAQVDSLPLVMQKVDPRIHMALNCGAKGCPAVGVYSGKTLEAELDDAVAAFLSPETNLLLEPEKDRVGFSMIFQWYLIDFLGEPAPTDNGAIAKGLLQWALPFTSGGRRDSVAACLDRIASNSTVELVWLPYDWSTNGADVAINWRVYWPRLR